MGVPRDGGVIAVSVGEARRVMCAGTIYLVLRGESCGVADLADHGRIVLAAFIDFAAARLRALLAGWGSTG